MNASQALVPLDILYYQILPSGSTKSRRVESRPAPKTKTDKPFYITDLDLSGLLGDHHGSSNLCLRYRTDLERALNDGLEQA